MVSFYLISLIYLIRKEMSGFGAFTHNRVLYTVQVIFLNWFMTCFILYCQNHIVLIIIIYIKSKQNQLSLIL